MEGEEQEGTWHPDWKGVKGKGKIAANKLTAEAGAVTREVEGEERRSDNLWAWSKEPNREPKKWQLKGYTTERGRSGQTLEIVRDGHLRSCWKWVYAAGGTRDRGLAENQRRSFERTNRWS
jgi:hypothetical protein